MTKSAELAKTLKSAGIDVRRAQQAKSPISGSKCIRVAIPSTTPTLENEFHRERGHSTPWQTKVFCWAYIAA